VNWVRRFEQSGFAGAERSAEGPRDGRAAFGAHPRCENGWKAAPTGRVRADYGLLGAALGRDRCLSSLCAKGNSVCGDALRVRPVPANVPTASVFPFAQNLVPKIGSKPNPQAAGGGKKKTSRRLAAGNKIDSVGDGRKFHFQTAWQPLSYVGRSRDSRFRYVGTRPTRKKKHQLLRARCGYVTGRLVVSQARRPFLMPRHAGPSCAKLRRCSRHRGRRVFVYRGQTPGITTPPCMPSGRRESRSPSSSCFSFRPTAPQLNPIERVWKLLRKLWLHNPLLSDARRSRSRQVDLQFCGLGASELRAPPVFAH